MNHPDTNPTYTYETCRLYENEALLDKVYGLLSAVKKHDHQEAFSEGFVNGLADMRLGHTHLLAFGGEHGEEVVGIIAVSGSDAELAVAPGHRRRGIATHLLSQFPDVGVWAHGNLAAARGLAEKLGRKPVRELLVMALQGPALDSVEASIPEGFEITNIAEAAKQSTREDVEAQLIKVNNEAFSWHPEQGGWDLGRLHRAMEANWYRDEDLLLLLRDGQLAGFHWTKWHDEDHELGEVYVVGLAEAFRGRGLGGPLVDAGVSHLASGGAKKVILYVEADNEPAVKRYRKGGFEVAETHVVYR